MINSFCQTYQVTKSKGWEGSEEMYHMCNMKYKVQVGPEGRNKLHKQVI